MDIALFLQDLWALISAALTLNANALTAMIAQPNAGRLAFVLAVLAGISRLLGDSVALFINRVTPRRFVLALLGGGLLFAAELALWAVSIWLIAAVFPGAAPSLASTFLVVAAASAPWLFGFLVFAPYLGELVRWVLRIWNWLIVLILLETAIGLTLVAAFVAATAAWLALRALGILFARRLEPIRNWFWVRISGTPFELTFDQQADELARRLRQTAGGTLLAGK